MMFAAARRSRGNGTESAMRRYGVISDIHGNLVAFEALCSSASATLDHR